MHIRIGNKCKKYQNKYNRLANVIWMILDGKILVNNEY